MPSAYEMTFSITRVLRIAVLVEHLRATYHIPNKNVKWKQPAVAVFLEESETVGCSITYRKISSRKKCGEAKSRERTCKSGRRRAICTLGAYFGIRVNMSGRIRWRIKLGRNR